MLRWLSINKGVRKSKACQMTVVEALTVLYYPPIKHSWKIKHFMENKVLVGRTCSHLQISNTGALFASYIPCLLVSFISLNP